MELRVREKTPYNNGAILGLVKAMYKLYIFIMIFVLPITTISTEKIQVFSMVILIPLGIYMIVINKKIRNNVGYQCIAHEKANAIEIHVGKDAARVLTINKKISGGKRLNYLERKLKNTLTNPLNTYGDDVRVVYTQLVAERINNTLKSNKKAFILAHTRIEIGLLNSLYNKQCDKANMVLGLGHALSQRKSKNRKSNGLLYKIKKIYMEYGVYHYIIYPNVKDQEYLEMFKSSDRAITFLKELDR